MDNWQLIQSFLWHVTQTPRNTTYFYAMVVHSSIHYLFQRFWDFVSACTIPWTISPTINPADIWPASSPSMSVETTYSQLIPNTLQLTPTSHLPGDFTVPNIIQPIQATSGRTATRIWPWSVLTASRSSVWASSSSLECHGRCNWNGLFPWKKTTNVWPC